MKHSEETKKKISEKRIAFYKNGGKHPMLGKKRGRPHNYIGKKWLCMICSKTTTFGYEKCKSCAHIGLKETIETRKKKSEALKGEKSYLWMG